MRFDIHYRSTFAYEREVVESHNELRAAPSSDDRQQVLHYDLRSTPSSRVFSYTDYWGTRVDAFGIRLPHDRLEVIAEATVETRPSAVVAASPRWGDVEDRTFREAHLEYLEPSSHTVCGGVVSDEAHRRSAEGGDDVVGTVLALHRLIGTGFRYEPGATYVGVSVDEVFAAKQGVCQDFAHLLIAFCRSLGLPARYVSGYFFARDEPVGEDPDEDRIDVQTHAWVEVAVPGGGWIGLDPTNRQEVGLRHIKIGHGRDYDDVAPLRGVYTGGASQGVDVTVEMRRSPAQLQQQQQQQ